MWGIIAEEYCLINVVQIHLRQHCMRKALVQCWPDRHTFAGKHSDILSQENQLFEICLVVCFLTVYNITEQSWLGRSAFTACGSTMNRGQHLTEAMACNRHLLQIFMFATVKFKTMLLEFLYLYIISDI